MDKTDRLRDYGLAFLLYEHGLGVCGYELIRELFIFIKLILNSYLVKNMNMFEQMPFSEKYPVFRKLAEIGDLRKLSREELELYDEDIKNMRDIYATRKFDEKRGMEKGMEKGMAKEKIATAYRLLSMGLSEAQVSTATELPLEEIQKMRK